MITPHSSPGNPVLTGDPPWEPILASRPFLRGFEPDQLKPLAANALDFGVDDHWDASPRKMQAPAHRPRKFCGLLSALFPILEVADVPSAHYLGGDRHP